MLLTELKIENYRGIQSLTLPLAETTVLIGENNSGKTTILHALRACLQSLRGGGGTVGFDEFDFHFENGQSDPTTAAPIVLTLSFEQKEDEVWEDEIASKLGAPDSILGLVAPNNFYKIQLRIRAEYSEVTHEIETSFAFLNTDGTPFPEATKGKLAILQKMRPFFYLSALRDASKEFSRNAQFWSPFIKNAQMDGDTKANIENQLQAINTKIIGAHGTFGDVLHHLEKIRELVALGSQDVVSVDAVPARIFDMLSKTQVSIASATGAKLPITRHGEGTQSLSVLMLFNAFLKTELNRSQGTSIDKPIVALEEPEAHLHPNAVRALWKTIADIDGQKIVASHSGDLLAEVDLNSIRRLYRVGGQIRIGQISDQVLRDRERKKFEFLVKRTRAELFFAKCWLLGEGETEAILFAGAAKLLGVDLEQAGVRCIEYRQGDIAYFLDAANALGIVWHVLTDADEQGQSDRDKAVARLPAGSLEADHISTLGVARSIEPYMAAHGFLEFYEGLISTSELEKLANKKNGTDYVHELAKKFPNGKPAAAHALVAEMNIRGEDSVPEVLRAAVQKAAELGRRS